MSANELSQTLTDQRECDREAIHLFSSIQNHGALLAFSWPDQRIQMISENAGLMLSLNNKEILGGKLEYIFSKSFIESVRESAEAYPWPSRGRHLDVRPALQGQSFDAYLYQSEGLFVLELEPVLTSAKQIDSDVAYEQVLKEFMLAAKDSRSLPELGRLFCSTIRKLTGLDRVMMYRFIAPTWHGEVIAEDRVTHSHSYLGHRFPSSDIPRPARDLYLRNQVRLIPDVSAPISPLTPSLNPLTKKPLDLSDSRLRSVAKVHLEYLKNMEVGASFSVSVVHNEELWGLITCHHLQPIFITQSQRTICEIIAHAFSIQAPLMEKVLQQNDRLEFELKLKRVVDSLRLSSNPLDQFFKQHRTLTETFRAEGLALVGDRLLDFAGLTPLRADIEEMALWLREKMKREQSSVLAIEDLPQEWAGGLRLKEYAAGVLAVEMPEMNNQLLLMFRPELIKTITWGGDPRKQLDARQFQGKINPRNSFEAWEEVVREKSASWERYEIDGILFLRDIVFDALIKKEQIIKELATSRNPS